MATYNPWDEALTNPQDPLATAQAGETIGTRTTSGTTSAGTDRETPTTTEPSTPSTPAQPTTPAQPYGWSQIQSAYNQYLGRTASEQEMQAQIGQGQSQAGVDTIIRGIQSSKEAHGYTGVSGYQTAVKALEAETDATARAAKHDELARKLYSDLKSYGHEVSWDGDILVVDGRSYTVGSQTTAASTTQTANPNWHTDNYAAPQYTVQGGQVLPGWESSKWNDPNHQTPKYVVGRILSHYNFDDAGFAQAVADIQKAYPGTTTDGKDKVTIPGVGTIDIRTGASVGGTGWAWQDLSAGGGGSSTGTYSPWASTGTSSGTSTQAPLGPAPSAPTWTPSGTVYTPGAIEQSPVGAAANESLLKLLANPEVISPAVLEQMKAQDRETIAQRAQLADQDMQAFGAASDYQFSPWLQAERAAAGRSRDEAVIKGARDLTIGAAEKNAAAKKEAIQLGLSAENQNMARQQLRESLKQAAAASGQTSDQIMSAWLTNQLQIATQQWLGKEGLRIDWSKLEQANSQFKEELLLRLQALNQAQEQFAANYGLSLAQLQLQANQQAYNQYWSPWA